MKVHHTISRAIKTPKPDKVYGARLANITLNGSSITLSWVIFGRKHRGKHRSSTTKGKA